MPAACYLPATCLIAACSLDAPSLLNRDLTAQVGSHLLFGFVLTSHFLAGAGFVAVAIFMYSDKEDKALKMAVQACTGEGGSRNGMTTVPSEDQILGSEHLSPAKSPLRPC